MNRGENIIFIISQPRSGSTLTQKLLSNNSEVTTASEPWLLLPYLSVFRQDLIDATFQSKYSASGITDFLSKNNLERTYTDNLRSFLLSLYPLESGKKYFVDKTPRYYEILDEMIVTFPQAKFLVLKRSPFAVLYSIITTWAAYKTKFRLLEKFYRDFMVAPFAIQKFCEKHKQSSNVLEVKYENIVLDPNKYVREIYDWAGLTYSENVLNIGKNDKVGGIFGDDVYKENPASSILEDKNANWEKKIRNNKDLSLFFTEYRDFLGNEFIEKYGYEFPELNGKKSRFSKSDFSILMDEFKKETERRKRLSL